MQFGKPIRIRKLVFNSKIMGFYEARHSVYMQFSYVVKLILYCVTVLRYFNILNIHKHIRILGMSLTFPRKKAFHIRYKKNFQFNKKHNDTF